MVVAGFTGWASHEISRWKPCRFLGNFGSHPASLGCMLFTETQVLPRFKERETWLSFSVGSGRILKSVYVCVCYLSYIYLYIHLNMYIYIGEGNGNPLQCSCLENPRDGRAWWAAVYGVTQSRTRLKQLSSSSIYIYIYILNDFWTLETWKKRN